MRELITLLGPSLHVSLISLSSLLQGACHGSAAARNSQGSHLRNRVSLCSTKVSELDNPGDVGSIAFDEGHVREDDLQLYNVSDSDWEQNPAMLVHKRSEPKGIPFCTYNGCKK